MIPEVKAFIQVRMSSLRFPGKVIAPFRGLPVMAQLIQRISQVLEKNHIVINTTTDGVDDPLVVYAAHLGVQTFRGSPDNVFKRMRDCLQEHPCRWIQRVNGDSPLLDPGVIRKAISLIDSMDLDLITNAFPKTFPNGQTVELINAETFKNIDLDELSAEEKEHATKYFYNRADQYSIKNFESGNDDLVKLKMTIDTLEDLIRLEKVEEGEVFKYEDLG